MAAHSDEIWQAWDGWLIWDGEPVAKIFPIGDSEFGAGLGEAEKGVSAVASGLAARSSADFAFCDLTADIVLRPVGVEGNLGAIEDRQKFAFVGVQAFEQMIEFAEAGASLEDGFEARPQGDPGVG